MCNLKKLSTQTDEVARLFDALDASGNAGPGAVYPGQMGVVVTQASAKRTLQAMTWGFPLVTADMRARASASGKEARPRPVNNARMDKMGSPFWKRWYDDPAHHCLIPISAFAEAYGQKGAKKRVWFSVEDEPVFAWAGLWRDSPEWGKVYTGCMTEANEAIAPFHDRMPVLLPRNAWNQWLTQTRNLADIPAIDAAELTVAQTDESWAAKR